MKEGMHAVGPDHLLGKTKPPLRSIVQNQAKRCDGERSPSQTGHNKPPALVGAGSMHPEGPRQGCLHAVFLCASKTERCRSRTKQPSPFRRRRNDRLHARRVTLQGRAQGSWGIQDDADQEGHAPATVPPVVPLFLSISIAEEVGAGSGRRGHVHEMYARTFAQTCKTPSTDPLLLFGLCSGPLQRVRCLPNSLAALSWSGTRHASGGASCAITRERWGASPWNPSSICPTFDSPRCSDLRTGIPCGRGRGGPAANQPAAPRAHSAPR